MMALFKTITLLALILSIVYVSSASTSKTVKDLVKRNIPKISDDFSHDQKILIARACLDAITLAQAGRGAAEETNNIYAKYFPADKGLAKSVHDALIAIIDGDKSSITIRKDYKDEKGNFACTTRYMMGETRDETTDNPTIILCPPALQHGLINVKFDNGPPGVFCDLLDPRTTWRMDTLGAIILHEYTHVYFLVEKLLGQGTVDRLDKDSGVVFYGPIDTQSIAHSPASIHIADSYSWFCSESFWHKECKRDFGRPVTGDDQDPLCVDHTCEEEQENE